MQVLQSRDELGQSLSPRGCGVYPGVVEEAIACGDADLAGLHVARDHVRRAVMLIRQRFFQVTDLW